MTIIRIGSAAMFVLVALMWSAAAFAAPFLYGTKSLDNWTSVAIIDLATGHTVASIPVGNGASGVAALPSGDFVYVGNNDDATVSVIETATARVVATIPVGLGGPGDDRFVAADGTGRFVYVTNSLDATISVIDTATHTVARTFAAPLGVGPVTVHPSRGLLYATTGDLGLEHPDLAPHVDQVLAVIDIANGATVATIPLPGITCGIAFHPNGSSLYATMCSTDGVAVIDPANNTVAATIPVGSHPARIVVHPAGHFVYVGNRDSGTVSVIKTGSNQVAATVQNIPGLPKGMAIDSRGNFVYVAGPYDSTVSVIDTTTFAVAELDDDESVREIAFVSPLQPTSTAQCKDGAWKAYGIFKNEGDCVSFVATQGQNPPAR